MAKDVYFEVEIDNGTFGKRVIRFETGRLAPLAHGSACVLLDSQTMVLSATSVSAEPREDFDFFPLVVDVEERAYAKGEIPGSYMRREGRPSTEAILACRLIDRPLRPSFVDGFRNEVQIVATVLAVDRNDFYDVLAVSAASLSSKIAKLPFDGPIAAVRLALIDGTWVAFPRYSEVMRASFELTVAGRVVNPGTDAEDVAIMTVEAAAPEGAWQVIQSGGVAPNEAVVVEGLEFSKKFIRQLVDAQNNILKQLNMLDESHDGEYFVAVPYSGEVRDFVAEFVAPKIDSIYSITDRAERSLAEKDLKQELEAAFLKAQENGKYLDVPCSQVFSALSSITKEHIRTKILKGEPRLDGRKTCEIRTLKANIALIPRVHGSALFERGETQVLGITTINMLRMEQQIDTLGVQDTKRYIHHYNFPPYSTGDIGRVGSPKRREIGHGNLAEKALLCVLPPRDEFPYAIRQVSEALASNGSTSMASVCASTLSLLSAGVPLRAPVAGIAMGLVVDAESKGDKFATLTDILGEEDALGDMDFKVAGTKDFITALQLDTKLSGLSSRVLSSALDAALKARCAILDSVMIPTIDRPAQLSPHAPRVIKLVIPQEKIGDVIGPKGKIINEIQTSTGADISIEDDGTVYIGAHAESSALKAREIVESIALPKPIEVNSIWNGSVVKIATFGAFVSLTPGRDGLLHISEARKLCGGKRVDNLESLLSLGQRIDVRVLKIDDRGKISLALAGKADSEDDRFIAFETSDDKNIV